MAKKTTHPVRYVDNHIVATGSEVWTWLKLPHHTTALRPVQDRENQALTSAALFRAILGDRQEPLDMHLRTVQRLFNVEEWRTNFIQDTLRNNPPPRFKDFVDKASSHLTDARSLATVTYLGVKLGSRDSTVVKQGLFKDLFSTINRSITAAANLDAAPFTDEDLHYWHTKASEVLESARAIDPLVSGIPAKEAVWLLRKPFYPTYACPDLDIPTTDCLHGESLDVLLTADIEHTPHHVEVSNVNPSSGERETFFTSTSCLIEFNRQFTWPDVPGWADVVKNTAPNAEWSIRFQVVPAAQVRKDVKKNLGNIEEELLDAAKANVYGGRTLDEQHAEVADLAHQLSKQRPAWLYATYRVQLRASSPEALDALASKVATTLRASNIQAARPSHDQLPLLMEAVPGSRWLSGLYQRRQDLAVLGASGLMESYAVGDEGKLGPYLGRVVMGDTPPVFFSTNRGIALDSGPVTLLTGAPGRGKTFLGLNLAYQATVQGYRVVYIDPKADTTRFANLDGLGNVNLFDLSHGHEGLLDPFRLGADLDSSALLALEVVRLLVGNFTEERETVLSNAIDYIKTQPAPSLWALSEHLAAHPSGSPEYNMGALLRNLRSVPFGRLLFAPKADQAPLRAEDGLTVVTLLGLDIPEIGTAVEDYSYPQRIGVATLFLLTQYAYALMEMGDKNAPKALFLDEAWALMSSRAGKALIERWGRMGRSHNAGLVLITQNTLDFSGTILNLVSSRFAFGPGNDPQEPSNILTSLGMPVEESTLGLVAALQTEQFKGHCLMRDPKGRVGLIRVDNYDRELFEVFNTNPTTRQSDQ